ncbi:hypothetical protein E4U28_007163 [Claviceps purpurea]|nr:hypothetical protein E4U28_007163 [Claviceps purpurea]
MTTDQLQLAAVCTVQSLAGSAARIFRIILVNTISTFAFALLVREGNYKSVSQAQSLSLKMAFSTVARRGYDKSPENDSRLEKLNKKMDNILERDDR